MFSKGQIVYITVDGKRVPCEHLRSVREWSMPNYELVYNEETDEDISVPTEQVFLTQD